MKLERPPIWVVANDASVKSEVQDDVGSSPVERWRRTVLCARDAMWAVRASPFGQRALEFRDPLPPSTLAALARLRSIDPSSR